MTERIVTADGVRLCLETFGDPGDPAVLLLAGGAQTMDAWEPEFCARLAAEGRHVVRYDFRDAGRSDGGPGYGFTDLVDDVARVLDAVDAPAAHLVGLSMGSGIALHAALAHPDRVCSLTLIGSSPMGGDDDLPPPEPVVAAAFTDPAPEPDWADARAVVEYLVEAERPFGGPDFDEPRARRVARATVERTPSVPALLANHGAAVGEIGAPALGDVAVPTLVLHGTVDPLFPLPHGEALAARIPGATLRRLEGVGHETPPPRTWDEVVPLLAAHTAATRAPR